MGRYIDVEKFRLTSDFPKDEDGELLVSISDVRSALQMTPTANVIEIENDTAPLLIRKEELRHLINDSIAYIQQLEERDCVKEKFGYFSRKKLLEKLKALEKEYFPELDSCN